MSDTKWAVETFEKYGIKTAIDNNGMIVISHYSQPKGTTFKEEGIDENRLIEHVVACEGRFDTRKSELTTFPLEVVRELMLDSQTEISEMPNLRAAGLLLVNEHLKKLPKLKTVGSISMENSSIKSLPKLKTAGVLIVQNSQLKELPSLEKATKLCLIDCPIENLKSLKEVDDMFLCSTKGGTKNEVTTLAELTEVKNLFVANSLKSLPKLKKAQKIALYNCEVKNVKSLTGAEVEIGTEITDAQLSEKFDTFTDWYNSDVLQKSMDLLGNIVNRIQS